MKHRRGFTLIETLIATLILVTGLVAVAGVFFYGARTSARLRRQTAATALLYTKMEELKEARDLSPGKYGEVLTIAPEGSYMRSWEVTEEMPRRITVIVYGKAGTRGSPYTELARATTLVGQGF
jgi:prepilin-type N-terminal cleavage/methylation domain-containing protein